ncbi:MAG: protein-glutamate O-methyltransferase CheR [Rhizobium rhizophilum]|jgi:chemotaxis protein methyltransferase CheR|uniref:Chemotaxis protein methyltransferase n=1 Tax=Rhizobium rhizophilum TaxID=1850373 RepID=A0ABY2R1E4_9HYPH|nr:MULTISPECIES: protein-glutamate O-methyltransferase CheR [Rhizobium]MBX9469286.1 protein-glutamate O-methylesterase CheR [Rhizobium sp.]QEE46454.1 chemotaxis protein [Rhizobium sp. WL3]THV16999.1 chemotaxis protein [Rhizobium rhizophilum]
MTFAMSTSRQSDDEVLASGEYPLTRRDLNEIAAMIYSDAGIALNDSKASLVYSRLSKHIRNLGLSGFRAYCQLVASQEGAGERREMLSHLTTNFTRFFRENHHFEHLRDEVLPGLVQRAKSGGRVRIWSAASSDGQEPYSIALTVFQAFPNVLDYDFKILATDIDPKILAIARQGAYDEQALETVSPAIRKQWFKEVEIGGRRKFQVDERLKRLITYNELNLMAQWPFKGKFDVIFCRNVVIYFDEPTQMRIWTRFADLLPVGGHLYIGHSERVSGDSKNDFDNIGITTYRYMGKNGGRK